jgi:imidazolonepropionase-like amidohydrolase
VAWNALTSEAARIAGVADRIGAIDRGMDADVVLWSGDPLDLGSRISAVYVDGARVDGDKR